MTAAKYMLGALALIATAAMLSGNRAMVEQAPLAMWRVAIAARDCISDEMIYRNIRMRCGTPLSFADLRKLEMRADNRTLGQTGGVEVLRAGN